MSLRKDMANIIHPYLPYDMLNINSDISLEIADKIINMISKSTIIIHPEPEMMQ